MRRRTFLTVGIAGAATLAAAGWLASALRTSSGKRALNDDARAIVAAIVPAMLDRALPERSADRAAAVAETVDGVDRAIQGLPPSARAELGQLFALLGLTPARRAFAGVASPWADATRAEIDAFLNAWRSSGWALKRSAYDALHQIIFAAWYGNPRSWPDIGYPGPPRIGR
jgi:hypothetical protein